jgi:hypothetical protein
VPQVDWSDAVVAVRSEPERRSALRGTVEAKAARFRAGAGGPPARCQAASCKSRLFSIIMFPAASRPLPHPAGVPANPAPERAQRAPEQDRVAPPSSGDPVGGRVGTAVRARSSFPAGQRTPTQVRGRLQGSRDSR